MPAKIQEVTTSQKLIKRFALVGQITPQLDETVVPVVVLDDLSDAEEWNYAHILDARPAAFGEYTHWEIENVAGSGRVLQLIQASITSSAAQVATATIDIIGVALGLVLQPLFEDLRKTFVAPQEFPAARVRFESLGAIIPGLQVWGAYTAAGANQVPWRPGRVLIYPGTKVTLRGTLQNSDLALALEWRERLLRVDGS